jgi:hypothetical protein
MSSLRFSQFFSAFDQSHRHPAVYHHWWLKPGRHHERTGGFSMGLMMIWELMGRYWDYVGIMLGCGILCDSISIYCYGIIVDVVCDSMDYTAIIGGQFIQHI